MCSIVCLARGLGRSSCSVVTATPSPWATGPRGGCCFIISVYGTQMHSSLTDRLPASNANFKLAEVLTRMHRDLRLTFSPHALCPAPTVNLAVKIDGGVGYGVCPGVAEFRSDIRTLPGMTRRQLQADLESCRDAVRR